MQWKCVAAATLLAGLAVGTLRAADPTTRRTDSGLEISIVTPGDSHVRNGDVLFVKYTGRLTSGMIFDSTDKHADKAPWRFTLGVDGVIKGWEEGLIGMEVGEKRHLVIPPELGYGDRGSPDGTIPPNSTLIFDIELVGLARVTPQQ